MGVVIFCLSAGMAFTGENVLCFGGGSACLSVCQGVDADCESPKQEKYMMKWMLSRIADVLLALLVMTVLLWYVLTQPVFSWSSNANAAPQLALDRYTLELGLRELLAIPTTYADEQARFNATSDYLFGQLSAAGSVEQLDRGEGQRILRIRAGKKAKKKIFVALHYVVTDKPLLESAETAISLIELAKVLNQEEQVGTQLNLSIFLHHTQQLAQSLLDVSVYNAEQLALMQAEDSLVLVFMPGLRLPEAAYASEQWRYFNVLIPSEHNQLSLFGRMNDVERIRDLKRALHGAGLADVDSLSIPASFPDMQPSPMKVYWDRGFHALLLRPTILFNDKNYYGHIKFISSWYNLLKQGS